MTNYKHLKELCKTNSELSSSVIDNFLLNYAASHDKLDKEFDNRISRFRHVHQELPAGCINMFKSQYIIHRVLRQGGLINRYLAHTAIKNLEAGERNFLTHAAVHPWRFSFSEITSSPAPDFFEMEDIYSGDSFLLYSPSITLTLEDNPVSVWFNLIGFNGACWQTFGPVSFYRSFDEDDIFFYATELNDLIETEEDLLNDVENNPVPYMFLIMGSNYPLVQNGEFELVQVIGETDAVIADMQELRKDFLLEYVPRVYKLTQKRWSGPPHFAEAYYEEVQQVLFLHGLSDYGYLKMAAVLKKYKLNLPLLPDIRVHLPMIMVIKKLLKKDLDLNPYSKLFEIKSSLENEALINKLNLVLGKALPFINAGEEPDIDAIAKEVGVDPGVARDIIEHTQERINKMKRE